MNLFWQILLFICIYQVYCHSGSNNKQTSIRKIAKPRGNFPHVNYRQDGKKGLKIDKRTLKGKSYIPRPSSRSNVKLYKKGQKKKNLKSKKKHDPKVYMHSIRANKQKFNGSKIPKKQNQRNLFKTKKNNILFVGAKKQASHFQQSRKKNLQSRLKNKKMQTKKIFKKRNKKLRSKFPKNLKLLAKDHSTQDGHSGKITHINKVPKETKIVYKNDSLTEADEAKHITKVYTKPLVLTTLMSATQNKVLKNAQSMNLSITNTEIPFISANAETSTNQHIFLKEVEPSTTYPSKMVDKLVTQSSNNSNGNGIQHIAYPVIINNKFNISEKWIENLKKKLHLTGSKEEILLNYHYSIPTKAPMTEKEIKYEKKIAELYEYQRKFSEKFKKREALRQKNATSAKLNTTNNDTKSQKPKKDAGARRKAVSSKVCSFYDTHNCVQLDELLSEAPELSAKIIEGYSILTNRIDNSIGKGGIYARQRAFEILKELRKEYLYCDYIIKRLPFLGPYLHKYSESCDRTVLMEINAMFYPEDYFD